MSISECMILLRPFITSAKYCAICERHCGWLVGLLRIYVALAVFQPYRDLEAGDNQSLKIQVARRGIEPRTSCSASQELNHSATAAPERHCEALILITTCIYIFWRESEGEETFSRAIYTYMYIWWWVFNMFKHGEFRSVDIIIIKTILIQSMVQKLPVSMVLNMQHVVLWKL